MIESSVLKCLTSANLKVDCSSEMSRPEYNQNKMETEYSAWHGSDRSVRHHGGGPGDSWGDGGGEHEARAPDEELRDDGLETHVLRGTG